MFLLLLPPTIIYRYNRSLFRPMGLKTFIRLTWASKWPDPILLLGRAFGFPCPSKICFGQRFFVIQNVLCINTGGSTLALKRALAQSPKPSPCFDGTHLLLSHFTLSVPAFCAFKTLYLPIHRFIPAPQPIAVPGGRGFRRKF